MSEPYEADPLEPDRLCGCGCLEAEHDASGRCLFCGPEDCGGWTYDPEGTLLLACFSEGMTMDDDDKMIYLYRASALVLIATVINAFACFASGMPFWQGEIVTVLLTMTVVGSVALLNMVF